MNMFEEARALSGMLQMRGMTQTEIAKKLGVSQSYVANKIRLLKFSESLQKTILDTGLCERQARQLLRLDSEEDQRLAIKKIVNSKMTVAQSEAVVDMLIEKEAPKRITRLEQYDRISSFENFISASLESLSAMGITADKRTEIFNKKRYITISIEENQ